MQEKVERYKKLAETTSAEFWKKLFATFNKNPRNVDAVCEALSDLVALRISFVAELKDMNLVERILKTYRLTEYDKQYLQSDIHIKDERLAKEFQRLALKYMHRFEYSKIVAQMFNKKRSTVLRCAQKTALKVGNSTPSKILTIVIEEKTKS